MPDTIVFAALLIIPGLLAYGCLVVGKWLGGPNGMLIGMVLGAALISVPFLTMTLSCLQVLLEHGSLVPKYPDQLLGLVLYGLITIGTVGALATLRIAWNRHAKT